MLAHSLTKPLNGPGNAQFRTNMDRAEKEEESRGRGGFGRRVDGQWDGAQDDDEDEDDDEEDFDVVETELSDEAMADADDWLHEEFWERVEAG
ncbi:hypothetical protein FPQ18DRAFT_405031 [Pyronema domesticum]|nr:hypothetical protein FPQ18DRAFT_405031 [Pyronema domesticum]